MKTSRAWVMAVLIGAGLLVAAWRGPVLAVVFAAGAEDPEKPERAAHGAKSADVREEGDPEEEKPAEGEGSSRVSRTPEGETVLTLDAPTQARVGLRAEAVAPATRQPETVAYGTLAEDPAETFTLRAALPGTLWAVEGRGWPQLGEALAAETTIGRLQPRLSPAEQLDMASRLATARADLGSATAELEAARASYESKKELRDRDKVVSDRAVEEAQARVRTEEARLRAAAETVHLLEACLAPDAGAAALHPLVVPLAGEVVEVLAQPGEVIESGQPILRVARFDRLMARVGIPAGERANQPVSAARVVVIGQEDWILLAKPIGLAPTVDVRTQGQAYQLRVTASGLPVRPGLAVIAYLALPGEPLTGVSVPRSAIVRYGGGTWVYVQTAEPQFTRREVKLTSPSTAGWFVTAGLAAGDRVVVVGAQVLLSEELKVQIEREQAAEE